METEKLQTAQPLNDIDGAVQSAIQPSKGNQKLLVKDFERRGRIVATIFSERAYQHGVAEGTTYMWVERHTLRGWRVLMIPADPHRPISVMPMIEVKRALRGGAEGMQMASLSTFDSDIEWTKDMSASVKSCYSDSVPGCWVHSKVGTGRSTLDIEGPSDVWVWVTERGCVCVGNKCHAATEETHAGAKQ